MKFASRSFGPQIDSQNSQNQPSAMFQKLGRSTFRAAACAVLVPILCGWFLAASAAPENTPKAKIADAPMEPASSTAAETSKETSPPVSTNASTDAAADQNAEMSVDEMLSLATKQLEDKLYFSAIETFTNCLDKDPRNARALSGRARAYRESGETDKALADEKRAQGVDEPAAGPLPASQVETADAPKDADKNSDDPGQLGNELLRKGDFKSALNHFNIALKKNLHQPELLSSRAACYLFLGNYNKAKVDLDLALKLNPKLASAYARQGQIDNKNKDYTQTIVNTGRSITLDPKQSLAYGVRAIAFAQQKQLPQALKDADIAVSNDPESGLAYYIRGQLLANQKNDKPVNDFKKAIELSPKYFDVYMSFAQLYANRLQWDKSVDILSKYIRENPNSADAYKMRSELFFLLTRYSDALYDANKVVELEPNKAASYVFRISKLIPMKRSAEALRDCMKGLSIEPKNAALYSQRSCLYMLNEQYNYGIADATKAISFNPKFASAYVNRGACYAAQIGRAHV